MTPVLAFWAVALLVGALAAPIAFALLRRLPDGGLGLSFALGLVLSGYAYFMLRTASILPPGRGGYLLATGLLGLVCVAVAGRDRYFRRMLGIQWPAVIAVAGLFTLFFFAYVAFRAYNGEINGTEQPMDFMYLNATINSEDYPPKDPWLAGERASYYYFGYLQVGLLTSVAGIPASTGYNLGLAYTFAAAATAIASLAYAMARWVLGTRARNWALGAAAAAIILLLAVGSLSAVFEWAAAHGHYNRGLYEAFGVEWLIPCTSEQLRDETANCYRGDADHRTDAWYPTEFWFWWRGTRIIPETITEFPFFSFLLGDLHPHVMSIPLVLLAIGLALAWWRGQKLLQWRSHLRNPWPGLAVAVILGGLAFQNAWDVITFCVVFTGGVGLRNLRRAPVLPALRGAAGYLAPVLVAAIIAYLPWYLTFSSQASGFYAYVGAGTRPAHAFLQFGPLLALGLLALTWCFRRGDGRLTIDALALTLAVPMLPFLAWALLAAIRGDLNDGFEDRGSGGWVTLACYMTAAWVLSAATAVLAYRRRAAAPVLALAAVGALLLYGAELFYIKDIFAGSTPRMNTVFKLTYQAWMLLAAAGGVALVVALRRSIRLRPTPAWLSAPAVALAGAGLIYPLLALPNRTDGFDTEREKSIDGLDFVARNDPDEYRLTQWVARNAANDVVIEASGRSYARDVNGQPRMTNAGVDYTDAGRIAGRAGSSTPIGWYFHEVQWRGENQAYLKRLSDLQDAVDLVYLSREPARVLQLMHQLDARYVVVGRLELQRYPRDLMPDFEMFLDPVFESGDLRVYELPRYHVEDTS